MIRIYKKLVRDNIPDICISNNQIPDYRILDDEEYRRELRKKLKEETKEYLISHSEEELADIVEVVEALAKVQGVSFEKLLEIKEQKAKKNGKFDKRYFLERVKK